MFDREAFGKHFGFKIPYERLTLVDAASHVIADMFCVAERKQHETAASREDLTNSAQVVDVNENKRSSPESLYWSSYAESYRPGRTRTTNVGRKQKTWCATI